MRREAETLAVMGTLKICLPFVGGKKLPRQQKQNADILFIGNWECNRCTDVLQLLLADSCWASFLRRTFSNQFIGFVSRCVTVDSIIQLPLTDIKTPRCLCFLPTLSR